MTATVEEPAGALIVGPIAFRAITTILPTGTGDARLQTQLSAYNLGTSAVLLQYESYPSVLVRLRALDTIPGRAPRDAMFVVPPTDVAGTGLAFELAPGETVAPWDWAQSGTLGRIVGDSLPPGRYGVEVQFHVVSMTEGVELESPTNGFRIPAGVVRLSR